MASAAAMPTEYATQAQIVEDSCLGRMNDVTPCLSSAGWWEASMIGQFS